MFKLKFSPTYELEKPNIVLSTCYHKHLGNISKYVSFNSSNNLSSAQEISFDIYKEVDGDVCKLWNDIKNFKYVFIPEYKEYYEISVSLDESDDTIKHITGRSACEWELSNRKISIEINTEIDIQREDYKIPTVFYNAEHPEASLLHRVLADKCGDYTIAHVDSSLANIQRTFSADNTSVYDFLISDIAEEIGCLFRFDSVNRTISVYDLYTVCKNDNCKYRGEFSDKCPKCNGTDLYNYGKDTGIFISTENYAESITVEGGHDEVKNCFKIEGGDDLITATVANCNPSGNNYIYHFTEDMMSDMPEELVNKIVSYNELYESKQDEYIDCTDRIYELIDREHYLQTSMMPDVKVQDTTAEKELNKLMNELLKVEVVNVGILSKSSADLAIKGMARVILDMRYDVDIISSTLSEVTGSNRTWKGIFKVYNTSAKDEDFIQSSIEKQVTISCDNYEEYLRQKIQKTLDRKDLTLGDIFKITDLDEFKAELKKYALDSLKGFESGYNTVLELLIENGVTDSASVFYDVELYEKMYKPYYTKLQAIQTEMVVREEEIKNVVDERNSKTTQRNAIQKQLDFRSYLGDLWNIFCLYLYEDIYSNSNYISDGLSNSELITKAKELFNVAKDELAKASELQLTLKVNVNNMLTDENFKPYLDRIEIGNWLRVKVNDKVYKLRLISIDIGGDDLDDVTFEFSNITKSKNNMSDAQDIISKMQNVTSSYDYVSHQSEQGKKTADEISDWRKYGLDAAKIAITNGNNQNIVYDEHGFVCRLYDDVLDDYNPEQIKIINNVLAMTKNNWETVSAAIGKLKYKLDGVEHEDYGVNADHVVSGVIIGGDIYSGNYSSIKKEGTHIGLNDETIQIGGDALTYNTKDGLSIKGKIAATSGKIGNWDVNNALYSGTDSMTSSTPGTYLGTDGIRNYKDTEHYVNIQNGSLNTVGGAISGSNISGGTITGGAISGGSISGTTINNGNGTFVVDSNGTVTANSLISNNATITGGSINIEAEQNDNKIILKWTQGTIAIRPMGIEVDGTIGNSKFNNKFFLNCSTYIWDDYSTSLSGAGFECHQISTYRNYYSFGTSSAVFGITVFTPDGTVSVSDANYKNNISPLSLEKSSEFIYSLKPSKYKLNNGSSNRMHHGFIAQDVKKSMGDDDWGVYVDASLSENKEDNVPKQDYKALRYEELIADLVATVQLQNERIKKLEAIIYKGGEQLNDKQKG